MVAIALSARGHRWQGAVTLLSDLTTGGRACLREGGMKGSRLVLMGCSAHLSLHMGSWEGDLSGRA